jgi:hypothetical protein
MQIEFSCKNVENQRPAVRLRCWRGDIMVRGVSQVTSLHQDAYANSGAAIILNIVL